MANRNSIAEMNRVPVRIMLFYRECSFASLSIINKFLKLFMSKIEHWIHCQCQGEVPDGLFFISQPVMINTKVGVIHRRCGVKLNGAFKMSDRLLVLFLFKITEPPRNKILFLGDLILVYKYVNLFLKHEVYLPFPCL